MDIGVRLWFEPTTASLAIGGISAASSVASGVSQMVGGGSQARVYTNQGELQGQFYENQVAGLEREIWEATHDLDVESTAAVARAAAVSAAQGGDLDFGIVSGIAGKYGMMRKRIEQEGEEQKWMLLSRAHYARVAANAAAMGAQQAGLAGLGDIISGTAKAGKSLYDYFGGGETTPKTGLNAPTGGGSAFGRIFGSVQSSLYS